MAEITVTEIVNQISMEINNKMEDFIVREVMDYADKHGEKITINAKMIYEAVKKQIPKKPLFEGDGYYDGEMVYDGWRCPNCDEYFEIDGEAYKYCPECNQRIDWGEGESE